MLGLAITWDIGSRLIYRTGQRTGFVFRKGTWGWKGRGGYGAEEKAGLYLEQEQKRSKGGAGERKGDREGEGARRGLVAGRTAGNKETGIKEPPLPPIYSPSFLDLTGHLKMVTGHMSFVTSRWSQVTGHMLLVTCLLSQATGHESLVTSHVSLFT